MQDARGDAREEETTVSLLSNEVPEKGDKVTAMKMMCVQVDTYMLK